MTDRSSDNVLGDFLRGRDVRCPSCGYSLCDCEASRCPECGAGLALGVVAAHGRGLAWWAAASAGCMLASLMAISALLTVLENLNGVVEDRALLQMIAGGFAPMSDAPQWKSMALMLVVAVVTLASAVWLLAVRRSFMTWDQWKQIAVGAAGALSPFMLLGVLYLMIRHLL